MNDLDKFLISLDKELNYSDATIKSYRKDITDYLNYLKTKNINYLKINRNQIRNYLKFLDESNLKNKSIARKLSSLRSFYTYLVSINKIDDNIFLTIKNPKIEKKLPNFLSYNEIDDLLNSIDDTDFYGARNRLIMELLYATGCRVSEICNIKIKDIDKDNKTIKIMGKGKKERIVFYGEYASIYLDKYLRLRKSESEYLLLSDKLKKIEVHNIENIVKQIVDKLSLKHHVTPHTLRHTFATHLLNNGADIKSVQELLGHTSLNTTGIYTHVTNDRLKSVYFHSFPRKGEK